MHIQPWSTFHSIVALKKQQRYMPCLNSNKHFSMDIGDTVYCKKLWYKIHAIVEQFHYSIGFPSRTIQRFLTLGFFFFVYVAFCVLHLGALLFIFYFTTKNPKVIIQRVCRIVDTRGTCKDLQNHRLSFKTRATEIDSWIGIQ